MGDGLKRVAKQCGGITVKAKGETARYDADGKLRGESKEDVLAPFVPADRLMAIMWFPALQYAISDPGTLAAFRADTGNKWTPGRTSLDRMIEDATGSEADFVRAFAAWFNSNVWGDGTEA